MKGFKVVELKSICKGLGLKGYSKLRKKELIDFIENYEKSQEKEIKIEEEECSICLDDKTNEVMLKCKHSYCKDCIELWERNNKTCPLCRKIIKRIYKKEKKYVKVIDINDYLPEEDFINYMRNLNILL